MLVDIAATISLSCILTCSQENMPKTADKKSIAKRFSLFSARVCGSSSEDSGWIQCSRQYHLCGASKVWNEGRVWPQQEEEETQQQGKEKTERTTGKVSRRLKSFSVTSQSKAEICILCCFLVCSVMPLTVNPLVDSGADWWLEIFVVVVGNMDKMTM